VVVIAAMPPEPLPVLAVSISAVAISLFLVWRMLQLARILGVTTTQLARARRELQVQATHDPLTGLLNRAVLDEVLESVRDPAARPAALLSIDLDEFKAVNDTYGHLAGDAVLTAVSNRLRRVVRADDLVLRTGGDEFLAVLRNVQPQEAQHLAGRIVTAVEEPVDHDGVDLRVSASVGVALLEPGESTEAAEVGIARADAAMYEAKRTRAGAGNQRGATPPGDGDLHRPATVRRDDDEHHRTPTRPGPA
jgi:diguanylate cyclase (GGDEF)-like protein